MDTGERTACCSGDLKMKKTEEHKTQEDVSSFDLLLRQRGVYVFAALFLCFAFRYFSRDLWFDECLTLDLLYYCQDSLTVYRSYDIPNNHIVFSVFYRYWLLFIDKCAPQLIFFLLRVFPLAIAGISAVWIFRELQRRFSWSCAWCVSVCIFLTPPVLIYGTGIRGYILGFFLAGAGLICGRKLLRSGGWKYYVLYLILSLAAVGTAPTNLASFSAIALLLSPGVISRRKRILPLLWLYLIPFIALAIFYVPIFDKFMGCIALKEGWFSSSAAAWNFYGTVILCLLPCLIMMRLRKKLKLYAAALLLTFLIPAVVYLIFPTPPFPRVFLPMLAVWGVAAAYGIPGFLHRIPSGKRYIPVLLVFFWCALLTIFSPRLGDILFPDGWHDDMMSPYYVREDFVPSQTVKKLEECRKNYPGATIYMTFDCDYPSILYAASHWADRDSVLWYDRPNANKLQSLPENGTLYFITRDEKDMEQARQRFGLPVPVEHIRCGAQHIWRFSR